MKLNLKNRKTIKPDDIKMHDFYVSDDGDLYYVTRIFDKNVPREENVLFIVTNIGRQDSNVMLTNKEALATYLSNEGCTHVNVEINEV